MNRPVSTSASNAARHHLTAPHTTLLLLLCTVAMTVFAFLSLFIDGSAPQTSTSHTTPASPHSAQRTTAEVREVYGQLPLNFEANQGQADESFDFLARGAGYTLSLSPTAAVFALARQSDERSHSGRPTQSDNRSASAQAKEETDTARALHSQRPQRLLRMNLLGANRGASVEGLNELEGKVNYFTGNDPSRWRANIPTFGRVRYAEVYPGIDVLYYGNQRQLEYDFVVAPGRDARAIALKFAGADKVEVSAAGELLLTLGESIVRQPKPLIYQEVAGARHTVEGGYVVESDGRVVFSLGNYDPTLPLVIDPVLVYSTYFGGSGSEQVRDIAVDAAGNAYMCGETSSTNFPTVNAFDASFNPGNSATDSDAFVAKLNAAGTALVYSTYLGGTGTDVNLSGADICYGITVDSGGNAYVTGQTRSTNFPTANPIQATYGGGLSEGFLTKLNAAGNALVYSTYLGGDTFDE
ncbi:MAG TPA: SBBP repeat-containing protein, partial [Pyrinomonadaceae bacterium]